MEGVLEEKLSLSGGIRNFATLLAAVTFVAAISSETVLDRFRSLKAGFSGMAVEEFLRCNFLEVLCPTEIGSIDPGGTSTSALENNSAGLVRVLRRRPIFGGEVGDCLVDVRGSATTGRVSRGSKGGMFLSFLLMGSYVIMVKIFTVHETRHPNRNSKSQLRNKSGRNRIKLYPNFL